MFLLPVETENISYLMYYSSLITYIYPLMIVIFGVTVFLAWIIKPGVKCYFVLHVMPDVSYTLDAVA